MTDANPRRLISSFTLAQITSMCGASASLHGSDGQDKGVVTGLGSDSRSISDGDLFVALVGERFDGHDFLEAVAEQGASAALVSTLPDEEVLAKLPCILVEDTLVGLQWLARDLFDHLRFCGHPRSIALTGSNGKTTTKEILRALWSAVGTTYATHGNLNNHIGVPLTVCNMPQNFETIVVEMGANHVGDIAELIRMAPSDHRIITSIGNAHIEGFGGLDGVRRGKREILSLSTDGTLAVVPHHERDALVTSDFYGRVWTFGPKGSGATLEYDVEAVDTDGMSVWFETGKQEFSLKLPLLGEHNASNLAAALATVLDTQEQRKKKGKEDAVTALDVAALNAALATLSVPGGRWRKIEVGDWLFLDDAYNANPSSVLASFQAFVQWQRSLDVEGPRVAVIGEMLELGEDAKNFHQAIARSIAKEESLHLLVCVGAYAAAMVDAIEGQDGLNVIAAKDVAQAASALEEHAGRGVVFLKASRGARLERVIDIIQDGCPE